MAIKRIAGVLLFSLIYQFALSQNSVMLLVKDSTSGEPVDGAVIIQQGAKNGKITDAAGSVRMLLNNKLPAVISISSVGFITKKFDLYTGIDTIQTIVLSPLKNELAEVTVSSVRTHSRIENIPTRIEVIGADDLDEENGVKPGNIASLLGDIAGIQMQQVSASSGNMYARIEGLNGRYTQLLKDGLPLFGGLSGSFGIMQIPPLDLKQIEIIKGSASTLYGGDAIGGIINLISKNPLKEQELDFTLNRSTLKETNLNVFAAKRYKKFGYTFTAAHTSQAEGDIDKDGLSDVPNVNSTVIHPKLLFYLSPHSTFTLNYTATLDRREGGDMKYISSKDVNLYHINNYMQRHSSDIKWQYNFSENNIITAKFSNSFMNQDMGTKYYDFKATQWIYYSEISWFYKHNHMDWVGGINFNGDLFRNNSNGLSAIKNYRYSTAGAFLQNTWLILPKITLESGVRFDHHSDFGNFLLPRLALLYRFNHYISVRVNGGTGYKVPVLLNYVNTETDLGLVSPGTQLQPELSRGINADINFHRHFSDDLDIIVNQSFFFTDITRPVYDSSQVYGTVSLINGGKPLQTKGFHTYSRVNYHNVEIYIGYVYTDVRKKYDIANPLMPVTPKHNFSAAVLWEPSEKWRFGMEGSYIAGQVDEKYNPVKNYFLLAAMVQYNIKAFSFVLNGENLLDFRQNRYGKIYEGTISNPVFHQLWAPVDGRVINLSVKWRLFTKN